ncbi:MAG: riboflavin synthase [Gammaproteobacteria bacterium]|jgi:riboflavin synthase
MFSGIVLGTTKIKMLEPCLGYNTITLELAAEHCAALLVGASVAIDGVCLTVTSINDNLVSFDIIDNSLTITTLQSLVLGREVNYERSLVEGGEIGGHILSGHIDYKTTVVTNPTADNGYCLTLAIPIEKQKYWFSKGFVGINGCSLTVSDVDKELGQAIIWLIPETIRQTNLGLLAIGGLVNIEIDRNTQILVDTVYDVIDEKFGALSETVQQLVDQSELAGELVGRLKRTK